MGGGWEAPCCDNGGWFRERSEQLPSGRCSKNPKPNSYPGNFVLMGICGTITITIQAKTLGNV